MPHYDGHRIYGKLKVGGVKLPSYNLTQLVDGSFSLNVTELTPRETMSMSLLTKINVNNTHTNEIKREFCQEIEAISLKYSEPEVRMTIN